MKIKYYYNNNTKQFNGNNLSVTYNKVIESTLLIAFFIKGGRNDIN